MKKSVKWSRFFESFIYFILLTIPLISVFARVIYVQSNHEAYRSYYGGTIPQETLVNTSYEDLVVGRVYRLSPKSIGTQSSEMGSSSYNIFVSSIRSLTNSDDLSNVVKFSLYSTTNGITYINLKDDTNTTLFTYNSTNNVQVFEYQLESKGLNGSSITLFDLLNNVYVIYNQDKFLDNAFDYGLQKTIDDFGVGNINFLNWFGTMFSNNNNLLYINFVNMYLNYALWVSVGYLIYYFLTFFVKIIRNLVDSFIRKGESW